MDDAPEPRWNDVLPSTYWEAVADPWVEGVATFLWHGPQAVAEGNRHARSVPDWPAHLVAIGDDGFDCLFARALDRLHTEPDVPAGR